MRGSAQARWSVDAAPILDVKGVGENGAVVFGNASWATRLADGSVVVADVSGPTLRWLDSKGKLVRSTGQQGQGPGDFRTLTWVARCARDSVFAWDFAQSRVTVFDVAGRMGRTIPIPPNGGGQLALACNPAGMFAMPGRGRRLPPPSPPDPGATYAIVNVVASVQVIDAAGNVLGTTPELPYVEAVSGMIGGRGGGMPRPLGQNTSFALSATRLFVGTGDSASIGVYSLDGKRVSTIPIVASTLATTRAQYERAVEAMVTVIPGPMREASRAWVLAIPMPARLPMYTGLFSDPDGLVWVVLSAPGDAETRVRALRPGGPAVADLVLPANFVVFEIGSDYVLGAREDSDGEPHVLVLRLRRGRGLPE